MKGVKSELGRIWTFYSYKGGTGRSMLLANLAWILADHGKRVLVIDWDLEAPGLHRYYRPFLDDPELTDTPGLIDHFTEFIEFAHIQSSLPASPSEGGNARPWHEPWIRLERNAVALDHSFENGGVLEFIGAGRQSASYAARVSEFNWKEFYDKAGGGILLEAIKQHLRSEYNYILIDSRTGLSDTAGICTVQMPDELMVCFTLNRQSIFGAAATAESAARQRRKPTGEPGLKIWPIACRVESAEKARLDQARSIANERFANQIWQLNRQERALFWSRAEVTYFPYYAYEEILATVAERPGQRNTLLECLDVVLREITCGRLSPLTPTLDPRKEAKRKWLMNRFEGDEGSPGNLPNGINNKPIIYIIYSKKSWNGKIEKFVDLISRGLPEAKVIYDSENGEGDALLSSRDALEMASIVVVVFNWRSEVTTKMENEMKLASELGTTIIPVYSDGLVPNNVKWIGKMFGRKFMASKGYEIEDINEKYKIDTLVSSLRRELQSIRSRFSRGGHVTCANVEDPQKGQWGGKSESNRRRITASVSMVNISWYKISIRVESTSGVLLDKDVVFYLHPKVCPYDNIVKPIDGKATLEIHAWGAFTVGAETDDGKTRLELDLSELESAPKSFRER